MPPKAPTHIEHNVYLTTSVTFDNKKDDFGRLQIYQAFSSLDEANEYCEAKADELALSLDTEAPEPTLAHYTKDGTFRMELPLEHRKRDVVVETLIMPLLGGVIAHSKPVSRKSSESAKAAKSKPRKSRAKKLQDSDDEDQDVEMFTDPASPQIATTITRKPAQAKEQRDPVVSGEVTEADIAAAPSGAPDCLQYGSYSVIGHHNHWSEEQIKVIVRKYGGTVKDKFPMYANDHSFSIILGSKAPSWALRRIKQKEFAIITPAQIIASIRNSRSPDGVAHITSDEVAKLCKTIPGNPATKRVVKDQEMDSDEQDVKSEHTSDED